MRQFFIAILIFVFTTTVRADSNLLEQGTQANREGIHEIATNLLSKFMASTTDESQRQQAILPLADSLLETNQAEKAIEVLQQAKSPSPQLRFLTARAFAAIDQWQPAINTYQELIEDGHLIPQAGLGIALAEYARGNSTEALQALQTIQDSGESNLQTILHTRILLERDELEAANGLLYSLEPNSIRDQKIRDFLRAKILYSLEKFGLAAELFLSLIENHKGESEELYAAVHIGYAKSAKSPENMAKAQSLLATYIDNYPDSKHLPQIFQLLFDLASQGEGIADSELETWSQDENPNRSLLARYYRSLQFSKEGADDKSKVVLKRGLFASRNSPSVVDTMLRLAELHNDAGEFQLALEILATPNVELTSNAEKARQLYQQARANFGLENFAEAAADFSEIPSFQPELEAIALYNEALCYLYGDDDAKYLEIYRTFSSKFPESELRSGLVLEDGLQEANSDPISATTSLNVFLRDFPEHPRTGEAYLALAEIAYLQNPPEIEDARNYLQLAQSSATDNDTRVTGAYLELFIDDASQGVSNEMLGLKLTDFLDRHPNSRFTPQARMKLGEIYYQDEDYANALTQFEMVTAQYPDSFYFEKALFLAAQATRRTMNEGSIDAAIEKFEAVAGVNGELKLHARLQQGYIYIMQEKYSEAVIIFDDILNSDPSPAVRHRALMGKGEAYYASAQQNPDAADQAIETYETLAKLPDVPDVIRHQALWQKGQVLERREKVDDALAAYYDVFALDPDEENPEFFWYYKAAFDAGRILEKKGKWESAIGIYHKLAQVNGPRAVEAQQRLNRLRLEHFLWEE